MERAKVRLERLISTRAELLEMLGNDSPNYVQKQILSNLDKTIAERELIIKNSRPRITT